MEAIKIRGKARFLEEGERSSRYFYSLEKRQQANYLRKTLTTDNLDTITDIRDILSETYYFYKDLYSAEPTDEQAQQEIFNTYAIPCLPDQERNQCNTNLTERELHKALSSLENNKSPGIDGFC